MVTLCSPCATDNLSTASSPSVLTMFPVAGQPVLIQPVDTAGAVWRIGPQKSEVQDWCRLRSRALFQLCHTQQPAPQPFMIPGHRCERSCSCSEIRSCPCLQTSHLRRTPRCARSRSASTTMAHKAVLAPSASAPHPPRRARVPLMRPPYHFLTCGLDQSLRCHCSLPARAHLQDNFKPS